MTISETVRQEISCCKEKDCCKKALLSGLIHTSGELGFSSEGIRAYFGENKYAAAAADEALTSLYGTGLTIYDGRKALCGEKTADILQDLGILRFEGGWRLNPGADYYLLVDDCCKKAYLKGAFLGGGSMSVRRGYELEFASNGRSMQEDIHDLLEYFGLKNSEVERGGKFRNVLKNKDTIADCLALLGANKAVLAFSDLVVRRTVMRDSVRVMNCDLANTDKLVKASMRHREAIKRAGDIADVKLKETAEARIANPDASLSELAAMLGVSKSAVRRRLDKIAALTKEEK